MGQCVARVVEPVRGAIYDTRLNHLGPSPCLRSSWMWWSVGGLSRYIGGSRNG